MGPDMREVDLVEDDEAAPAAARPPRASRRRPSWSWLVAGALCVVASLVMVQTAVDARRELAEERAPRDVLALPAPPRTLSVLWRVEGAARGAVRVGSELVGATVGDGTIDVVGIDPGTGAHEWVVTAPAAGDLDVAGVTCSPLDGPASARVVCLTVSRAAPPHVAQVVVVDTVSRTLLGSWVSDVQAWSPVGGLVVTATPDEDGSTFGWTLTAHEPSGAVAWTTRTSRAPLVAPGESGPVVGQLAGADGWVAVTDRGHAWVVGADGTVLADRPIGVGFVGATRSGAAVLGESRGVGSWQSTVLLDGGEVRVPGVPESPASDDRSSLGVDLYTLDDEGLHLVARDAATGAELWRDAYAGGALAVHDGVVYAAGGDEVRAYDATDGTRRWSTPLAAVDHLTVDDAGTVLASSVQNSSVLAVDARTGRALWKSDVHDVMPVGPSTEPPFLSMWAGLLYVAVGEDAWVIG